MDTIGIKLIRNFLVKDLENSKLIIKDVPHKYKHFVLSLSCHFGNAEFLNLMIENGADINQSSSAGFRAFLSVFNKAHEYPDEIIECFVN